eukprot:TRINITY_DN57192_c0_g1_i1.p1 TRINITY_DN57192_c0_g1~~TRINITY_DN57192_c0_g1_i1.p1  ORF type:complete len:994 (-),score=87.43 TRINITY_DN57192_c0_g1_i1:128-3109(-)
MLCPVLAIASECWMWRPPDCPAKINLFGNASAHTFHGHGAMAVRGGSKLLYDYPEPVRSEILDYLFSPGVGAALQVLKVEVGGDSQSGLGTEPSHRHNEREISCSRVRAFWLIREARQRNPNIIVYALPWALPYWVGVRNATQTTFHSTDAIDYLVTWIQCAHSTGAGVINYLGNRHNRHWGPSSFTVALRAALDAADLNATKLVLPDAAYEAKPVMTPGFPAGAEHITPHVALASSLAADQNFADAMAGGAIAIHYPCYMPLPAMLHSTGLPLWSSEDIGVEANWAGAGCLGRTLNTNFVRMNISSTIVRSMAWAAHAALPGTRDGLLEAMEPWSGSYKVRDTLWALAHTTQFTAAGWLILSVSSGSTGHLKKGGTYVTYVSPLRDRFALVVEKLHGACSACSGQVTGPEPVTFTLHGSLLPRMGSAVGQADFNTPNTSSESNESNSADNFSNLSDESYNSTNQSGGGFASVSAGDDDSREDTRNRTKTGNASACVVINGSANGSDCDNDTRVNVSNTSASNETFDETEFEKGDGLHVGMWLTNRTHKLFKLPPLLVDPRSFSFSFTALPDTIYTISSLDNENLPNHTHAPVAWQGARHRDDIPLGSGEPSEFPIPYADNFDEYPLDASPRYFADYGGSFQVAKDPTEPTNRVLKQWVTRQSGANEWTDDSAPMTLVGSKNVRDVALSTEVYIPEISTSPAVHLSTEVAFYIQASWAGHCLASHQAATFQGVSLVSRACKAGWEQQFVYDSGSGHVRTSAAEPQCITAHICSNSPYRDDAICMLPCSNNLSSSMEYSNQTWIWQNDGSIRLRARLDLCLTSEFADEAQGGPSVKLLPCIGNGTVPSRTQQWTSRSAELETYAGACLRLAADPSQGGDANAGKMFQGLRGRKGYCLRLGVDSTGRGSWRLESGGVDAIILATGPLATPLGAWHSLRLAVDDTMIRVKIDGREEVVAVAGDHRYGSAALLSGWNEAFFDNFEFTPVAELERVFY